MAWGNYLDLQYLNENKNHNLGFWKSLGWGDINK